MHERRAIREAVIAQLVGTAPTWNTDAEQRVFKSRMAPLRTAELPALNVYTEHEEIAPGSESTAPVELTRIATIAIEGWVRAAADVDDACDDLAFQIESAMDLDDSLGGSAFRSLLSTTEVGIKMDGDRPMGCVHLEYTITYHTDLRVPAVVDDFNTADVLTTLTPGAPDPAHDIISPNGSN